MLEHKTFPIHGMKAADLGEGSLEAYVAVFSVIDSGGDRIIPGAFSKSLKRKLPVGIWAHNWEKPVAKTVEAEEVMAGDPRLPVEIKNYGGLRIKARFNLETERGRDAYSDIKQGLIDEFSFGYDPVRARKGADGARELVELWVPEWSPVVAGMNPLTQVVDVKTVCGASGLPLADRGRAWDAAAAEKSVRTWAGAEDAPNAKYRKAFMVCAGDADQFTSYKLPFATVDDGELKAVPRGVFAVAAVLQGSRGGASLSAEDRAGAKAKCESYYAAMRRAWNDDSIVVPWADGGKSAEIPMSGNLTVTNPGTGSLTVGSSGTYVFWPGDPNVTVTPSFPDQKSQSMPYLEHGMTMAAMHEAHNHLMDAVADGLYNGLGAHEIEPAYDEHKAACLGVYKSLMSGSKDVRVAAAKAIEQFLGEVAFPAEASFAEQLSAVLGAAEGCCIRGEEIERKRAVKGRHLSSDRQEELRVLRSRLEALGERIGALLEPAPPPEPSLSPHEKARLLKLRAEHRNRCVGPIAPPPPS